MKLIIGCTTRPYSMLTFAEACEHIAAAGYKHVAVYSNVIGENKQGIPVNSGSTPQEIAAVKKAASDTGLMPSLLLGGVKLNLGIDEAVNDYKKLIDNAAALGAKWLLEGGVGNLELRNDYYEFMRRITPYAQKAGVSITMKPHGGISLTIEDLLKAYNEVNHPAFGICYDPGNIIYYTKGELRPEDGIDKVAPTVTTGIIKDCVVKDGNPDVMVTAGHGLVDFPKVLSGLISGGFRGPLYVECVGGKEISEIDKNVKFTLGFVKDILEKL
ncbi:sugar phosphate isomerase/epimerase [Candidatus Poribacteria bacterium]|nr:sugar phosphate isomerase/epimerase [Candidatus Poribacteria bacterium]